MANLLVTLFRYLWDPTIHQERRVRKQQAVGRTECSLRVVAGSQDGLGTNWTSGLAVPGPGSLEFLPRFWQTTLPRPGQKWLRITVNEATRAHERTSKGREIWSVNPSARIITLRTPTAELEWAVMPEQRDWVLARVNGDPDDREGGRADN
jgi:hypothetical protein